MPRGPSTFQQVDSCANTCVGLDVWGSEVNPMWTQEWSAVLLGDPFRRIIGIKLDLTTWIDEIIRWKWSNPNLRCQDLMKPSN